MSEAIGIPLIVILANVIPWALVIYAVVFVPRARKKSAMRNGAVGIGAVVGYNTGLDSYKNTIYYRKFAIALDNGELFQWEGGSASGSKPIIGEVYEVWKWATNPEKISNGSGVMVDKKMRVGEFEHTANWQRLQAFIGRNNIGAQGEKPVQASQPQGNAQPQYNSGPQYNSQPQYSSQPQHGSQPYGTPAWQEQQGRRQQDGYSGY